MNLQESTENLQESNCFNNEPHKEQQRYRKLKVLGEGSMGKVYLVQETSSHLPFVMKRIHIGHLSQDARDAALREAQLHSLLSHPNIIQFKEIYHTTGDKLCIIMEYAEGGDLDEWIKAQNGKPIQEDVIIKILSQICLGLREVHQKKIVHRDLKGANIFLSKDQNVKIGDFGISKSLDRTVLASKSFVGTPYYLSPQMVEGKPYSTKSDIWSLGVILYHLCAQKLPFQAISLPVLALKILKGSFPPLTGNVYSKEMKALILSMLQVDSKKRPSAEQILNKPFIYKLLPKEQQQKCKANLFANKPKPKVIEQKKTLQTVQSPSIKHQIKGQKIKISEKEIKDALKQEEFKQKERLKKEQQRKKHEELRKNMREDLKLKRKQTEKIQKNYESVPQPKKLHQKSVKTISTQAKSFEQTASKVQLNTVKPWKTKKQGGQSKNKDIPIQIYVPEIKAKQQKKEEQQVNSNIKIEIFEGKKPITTNTIGRQSAPITQNTVQNYHYSQKNINFEDQDEEQEIQETPDLMDLLSNVRAANQLAANLNNPYGEIELYEESDNFDNTIGAMNMMPKNEEKELEELEDLMFVTKSENLQELRLIVEDKLGDDNFIQAYNIIKDYFDEFNQKKENSEQESLKSHIYNPTLLRSKLPFLTDKQFESSVQLLYAIVVLQDSQMNSNGENYISMLTQ